ncbi:TetR/AcrR family transcriptional regulator [Microscilla marina]|uniref:Transcriptional regulator, TetR family n=1 Tax=Microscilla marina ATCC 23134 TaxID=313606 RepID=A1ZLV8_MICM2|nr:TetR/AcrR family transcriptional regulator [Microscilla marina]EAY28491.1 transcriptional regulator, TetR family [Microscilla marina ATCC 23134]
MKKSEKTKRTIIEKSARLFNQKGYAGTSIQDIIKVTGMSKGSIYGNNFHNKDEIALAVFSYNVNLLFADLWAMVAEQTSARAKLMTFCEFHRQNYQTVLDYGGCPMLNVAIDSDDTHPMLNQQVALSFKKWETKLTDIIVLGIRQKEFKPETDAFHFAGLSISLIEGSIMLAKTHKDPKYILNALVHIEHLIDTLDINH